jgi:hypothetical protein
MSLTNKTIASSYKDLLQIDNSNNGLSTSTKSIKSGDGTNSCASISDDQFTIQPQNDNTTNVMTVKNVGGTSLVQVDSTNTAVKALGQYVNTNIQSFGIGSVNSNPSTDNWTMLGKDMGGHRFNSVPITMGSGGTPATTYDVSGGNVASNLVQSIWYLPFNITIDSVHVWQGADASSGDDMDYSVMSYAISTATDATGGDLSDGVQVAVSPSTLDPFGYDRALYQSLTVSSANVNSGRALVALMKAGSNNSDFTVSMQLVYHLRSA